MKKTFVYLTFTLLSIVAITAACKKEDTVTYKLDILFSAPSQGTTVFDTLSYRAEDGNMVTLTNQRADVQRTFNIAKGFNINLSLRASNNYSGDLTVSPSIYYTVQKVVNGNPESSFICSQLLINSSGRAGAWKTAVDVNKTFNETTCQ